MRIKKIAPVTPANGNIKNSYGTSQTDTYSQEYINDVTYEIVTGNGWTMKKYGNGILEGWCTKEFSDIVINTAWGSLYGNATNELLEFGTYPVTFLEEPNVNINQTVTTTHNSSCMAILWSSVGNSKTKLFGIRVIRPDGSSNGRNIAVAVSVKGKWK